MGGVGSGRGSARFGVRFVDGDSEVAGEAGEPVMVALPDCADLPGTVAAVELDCEGGCFGGEVVDAERGELASAVVVDADRDYADGETAWGFGVEAECKGDAVHLGIAGVQVDADPVFDQTAGFPLAVMAAEPSRECVRYQEHEVGVTTDLPAVSRSADRSASASRVGRHPAGHRGARCEECTVLSLAQLHMFLSNRRAGAVGSVTVHGTHPVFCRCSGALFTSGSPVQAHP